jgi:hypothetical protein
VLESCTGNLSTLQLLRAAGMSSVGGTTLIAAGVQPLEDNTSSTGSQVRLTIKGTA